MLFFVTFIAVAVAIVAAAYAWRIANAERQRSDARVAALAAAIDDDGPAEAGLHTDSYPAEAGLHAKKAEAGLHTPSGMFERAPRSGLQGRPLLKLGVGFAMAVLVIVLIAMSGDRERASADGPRAAAQVPARHELELLSMRHARTGDALRVTGLVRNGGAATSSAIMAVVFVFDRDGGFVASGRAPLEFSDIARGDQSPFQVTIPEVKDVGKYTVSFRTQAGIVPHVDLRRTLQVSN
jgi:hypothetical protein